MRYFKNRKNRNIKYFDHLTFVMYIKIQRQLGNHFENHNLIIELQWYFEEKFKKKPQLYQNQREEKLIDEDQRWWFILQ